MFHFNFDVDDPVDDVTFPGPSIPADHPPCHPISNSQQTFSEIDLDSLLKALPSQISYSFISPPSFPDLTLARRDLFDARFQLISEGTGELEPVGGQAPSGGSDPGFAASALQFIDNPSDLVPLVYEGGLKTWECSLDLASCLKRDGHAANIKGKRVLEVGCGTAIPTLCALQEFFALPPTRDAETHIHLQDYNASVLQLVTLPNIVLVWYTSPAAVDYRSSESHPSDDHPESEVHLTTELLQAFKTSLHTYRLHLRFFSGSWDTFDLPRVTDGSGPYHLVLTSETIYRQDVLPSLVRLLRDACVGVGEGGGVGDDRNGLCLVAAKTVYFGVGGGIVEFVRCVESDVGRGRIDTLWETLTGVSRRVMRVRWT